MLFGIKKEKNKLRYFTPLVVILLGICFMTGFAQNFSKKNDSLSKEILENALNRDITQCYALEGHYPPDITYIEENYGLTYDKDMFYIDYQYVASNLRPNVTIIERQKNDRIW